MKVITDVTAATLTTQKIDQQSWRECDKRQAAHNGEQAEKNVSWTAYGLMKSQVNVCFKEQAKGNKDSQGGGEMNKKASPTWINYIPE